MPLPVRALDASACDPFAGLGQRRARARSAVCEEAVEPVGHQQAVQRSLVVPPCLGVLVDRPDRRPPPGAVWVQVHPFRDGAGARENGGGGRVAGGEEPDVRARVTDPGKRVACHVPGPALEEVLAREVPVQQYRSPRCRTERGHGGPGGAQPGDTEVASARLTAGPLFVVGVVTCPLLEAGIDRFERRERERAGSRPVHRRQETGRHRVTVTTQRQPGTYPLKQKGAEIGFHVEEPYRHPGLPPGVERGRLRADLLARCAQLEYDLAATAERAAVHVRPAAASETTRAPEAPALLARAKPRLNVHSGSVAARLLTSTALPAAHAGLRRCA